MNEEEMLKCDGWKKSNCCDALLMWESDICSACGEHASPRCADCEMYEICPNDNKRIE